MSSSFVGKRFHVREREKFWMDDVETVRNIHEDIAGLDIERKSSVQIILVTAEVVRIN